VGYQRNIYIYTLLCLSLCVFSTDCVCVFSTQSLLKVKSKYDRNIKMKAICGTKEPEQKLRSCFASLGASVG